MIRVDWSNPALDDLDDIVRYISKDSPYYAREFTERVFDRTDKLGAFSSWLSSMAAAMSTPCMTSRGVLAKQQLRADARYAAVVWVGV